MASPIKGRCDEAQEIPGGEWRFAVVRKPWEGVRVAKGSRAAEEAALRPEQLLINETGVPPPFNPAFERVSHPAPARGSATHISMHGAI